MTTDGGGNPRFKGSGMQWKTAWGRRKTFMPEMPFFEGFLTNNISDPTVNRYYLGGAGKGMKGSVGGFWVGGVIFVRPGATAEVVGSYGDGATPAQGWVLSVVGTSVRFSVGDGATLTNVSVAVGTSDPSAAEDALVVPALAIYDANGNTITLYAGAEADSATVAFAGPFVTPVSGRNSLGGSYTGAGGGAAHLGINGLVGGNFLPTVPEVTAWFNTVKSTLKTSSIPAKTEHLWAANDYIGAGVQSVTAPATITDEIASTTLTLTTGPNSGVVINQYGAEFSY